MSYCWGLSNNVITDERNHRHLYINFRRGLTQFFQLDTNFVSTSMYSFKHRKHCHLLTNFSNMNFLESLNKSCKSVLCNCLVLRILAVFFHFGMYNERDFRRLLNSYYIFYLGIRPTEFTFTNVSRRTYLKSRPKNSDTLFSAKIFYT